MKIKSTVAGLIIATGMFAAVGASQAACGLATCPVQPPPSLQQFSGTGWHMVPCNTALQPARTWEQYASGYYAPPTTSNSVFLGL